MSAPLDLVDVTPGISEHEFSIDQNSRDCGLALKINIWMTLDCHTLEKVDAARGAALGFSDHSLQRIIRYTEIKSNSSNEMLVQKLYEGVYKNRRSLCLEINVGPTP